MLPAWPSARTAGGSSREAVTRREVWDAATGQETLTLKGHGGGICGVAFSPDGRRIVAASGEVVDKPGSSRFGTRRRARKRSRSRDTPAMFPAWPSAPTAGGSSRRRGQFGKLTELKVWDAATGEETLTLKGHTASVDSVAFSPDGRRIVSRQLGQHAEDMGRRDGPGNAHA